ncbi:hypothetical protein JCM10213_008683 [Rhodosporidiobolus nylandii]
MARSVTSSPSPPSSPIPSSPPSTSSIPPSLLLQLSPADLALASREVLLALVERQGAELGRLSERVGGLEEGEKRREEEARAAERERDGWRGRWEEVMGEQGRMEEELAGRVEVLDKLRTTVRELEREKRDATKRYREQADSFDSERQSWYDQEQHYKVRIANLSASQRRTNRNTRAEPKDRRKSAPLPSLDGADGDEADEEENRLPGVGQETEREGERSEPPTPRTARGPSPTPSSASATSSSLAAPSASTAGSTSDGALTPTPSANEVALRAQLDSLSTAHSSLTSTLRTLQTEMADLKRVYQDLQEENESYEILLGEKTLSGEVTGTELFRKSFQWGEAGGDGSSGGGAWNAGFGFAGGLEAVGEEGEDAFGAAGELAASSSSESSDDSTDDDDEDGSVAAGQTSEEIDRILLESTGTGSLDSGAVGTAGRRSRRTDSLQIANSARSATSRPNARGSLGGAVAATAGGLDLAAELEAANEREGEDEVREERRRVREEKRRKKAEEKERRREERRREKERMRGAGRRESSFAGMGEGDLHSEIRQLREANKALTLYVSKIVDRVCSQEGFEKVLAVDYREKTPKTPGVVSPPVSRSNSAQGDQEQDKEKKARPSSSFFRTPTAAAVPATPSSATSFTSAGAYGAPLTPSTSASSSSAAGPRKSGGLTWDGISSVFGFGSSASSASSTAVTPSSSSMKPLILSNDSSSSSAAGARKVDPLEEDDEDEDDRRERERIRKEMLQAGFEPAPSRLRASASPTPPPHSHSAPRTPEDERQRTLERLEQQEVQAKRELKEGRSSGFTDPPARRLSLRMERRHSARGSISYKHTPPTEVGEGVLGAGFAGEPPALGLGIKEEDGEELRGGGEKDKVEEEKGFGKALRRLSKTWTSPTLS